MTYHLEHIFQTKGQTDILKDINLDINDDSILAILGPSGGGKTTLLNILAKIDVPTSGKFTSTDESNPKGIMVFQDYRLFPHMTVLKNITFGLRMKKVNKDEIKKRAQEIMQVMGIEKLAKHYPDELSGGQQQRVSLARAMILRPKLLLMDEPFSSLDENLRMEMLKFVKSLQKKFQLTIIFVTHYKTEAYLLSNKIAILIDGQIMQLSSAKEIENQPANLRVAKFLGQANFIAGEIKQDEFESKVYSGPVEVKTNTENKLYIPYSNLVQLKKTSHPAFKGQVLDSVWIGNCNRLTVKIEQEIIQINSFLDEIAVGQTYQFYFSKLPVVF